LKEDPREEGKSPGKLKTPLKKAQGGGSERTGKRGGGGRNKENQGGMGGVSPISG